MALRGNLKDFSLPDVFQLVTFSRKTGVLRIQRADGAEGSVWFRDGDVFFAASNWHNEPLGERLVKAQRITPQALTRALEVREGSAEKRLGQILVDEGYITDKVLEAFVQEQIQDTIFDLMRWDEGEFDFEAMPEVVEEDIGLSVSIENIIMEGSRRLEEWTRIKKKVPSMDIVFKMATAPGEGTFEISLKPAEWNLLLLVDGTRSVAELALETSRTDFEVARVIYGLFSAGLLEFASDDEVAKLRAERAEREERLAGILEKQREAEAAAAAATQAREEALAAEAAKRREAEAQAAAEAAASRAAEEEAARQVAQAAEQAAAETAAIEAAAAKRAATPVEVPEFLGSGASAPTDEDVAVLEEMMGAVLERPATPVPEPELEPEPEAPVVHEPYVPAEEPAFMGMAPMDETELQLVPVPSVEDLFPGISELAEPREVEAAADAVAVAAAAALAEPPVELPDESVPQAVLPAEPEVTAGPEPIPASGFEIPLMPEAAEPEPASESQAPEPFELGVAEPASVDIPVEAQPSAEFEPEIADMLAGLEAETEAVVEAAEPVAAPVEPEPVGPDADFERDLLALGLGEMPSDLLAPIGAEPGAAVEVPAEQLASEEISVEEELAALPTWVDEEAPAALEPDTDALLADLAADLELPAAVPAEVGAEVEPAEAAPDFSALLQSLDVDAPEAAPLIASEPEADFDAELLRDETPVETGGVISTDSFLEDIAIDDLGFSGVLTDELSALTGADRPSRPTANVKKIPEATEAGVLKRDTRVDRDTLLKIIDGIKNL